MFLALTLALLTHAAQAAVVQPQQSFWALVVNDVPKGDVIAVLEGEDTWLPVAALEKAGLKGFTGQRRTMFDASYVRLGSLAPDITFRADLTEIVFRIIAAPKFFDTTVVVLQRDRPEGITTASTPTFFTNYSATWDQQAGGSGYGESGVSAFGNTSIGSGYTFEPDGSVSRGLSTMTVDRASARLRLQLGDTVAKATPLGSAPILAGFSFGRDYSTDPYYYRYPTPFIRGTATSPSDVEIYVNGALVRRLEVGPGPYRFDRLPVNAGLGDVRVVVRDPFGRQQLYQVNLYQPTGVLRKGEHDFQFAAGKLRDDSQPRPTYGSWQGTAFQRVGVSDWLTLGYSGEGSGDVVSGGPTLSMRIAKLGEVELNTWASKGLGATGFAAYGIYTFVAPLLNVSATAQYYGDGFANLFLAPGDVSTPEFYQVNAGVPVFSIGSLNYTWEQRRSPAGGYGYELPDGSFDPEKVRSHAQTLRLNLRLLLRTQLTASATLTRVRADQYWTGFAGINVVLGRRGTTANVTYSRLRDSESTFLDINKSLPLGPGIGYRLTASDIDGPTAGGQLEANTRFNRMRLNYDVSDNGGIRSASATFSGGFTATRAGAYLTRPLDSSVAIVEVQGLKDVGILVDNWPVGRTNSKGRLLVNELLPYLANQVSYVEEDIPFDYQVPVSSQLVAPPYRGAAYVLFKTARIQGRVGKVVLTVGGERVVPSFGTITVLLGDTPVESPLNGDGEFFLDLPRGKHTGTVLFKGRSCDVQFEATVTTGLVQNVGTLTCTP